MSAPGFRLCEASAGDRLSRDKATYEAWGTRLTLPQYLERERLLRGTVRARRDMQTWLLRLPNDVVVASAETFRLPLSPAGALEVIASVFVERPLRGVGMASRLIESIGTNRREAGLDGLVLFSEVGAGLYARAGFRLLPAPTRRWPARPSTRSSRITITEDVGPLIAARAHWRADPLDLRVDAALVEWHLGRTKFYREVLDLPVSGGVGALTDDACVLWAADVKAGVLRLLDASGRPGADLSPLVEAAADEAARHGLTHVELWDDTHSLALEGGTPFERDDDLPMGLAFTPRGELMMGALPRLAWA
ncbi:MAG: hypothetical protein RL199_830 [Pseudomonadota bacterium]|jgi:N-acetylglutamate synthase-like GNAT family acetyltransferase